MLWKRIFYFGSSLALVIFLVVYLVSENLSLNRIQIRPTKLEQHGAESSMPTLFTQTTTTKATTKQSSSLPTLTTQSAKLGQHEAAKSIQTRAATKATSMPTSVSRKTTTKASTKASSSRPTVTTQRPENYNLKRTFCSIKLSNGLMCPKLYTELGGDCFYNQSSVTCYDVRRKAFHSLRQAQLAITRLLGGFELVAKKHNITYWLTSGTLLGAVRHKGFIPWDADADIEITLNEYEKFYRLASSDLPVNVFFQNSESDPKLRPSNPEDYKRNRYKDIGLYRRTWNPRLRDVKSCYKYCIAYGCKWHDGLMVDLFVVESVPEGTFPLKKALFEGLHFPVPNNWREVLTDKYGKDFMEIPKDRKQSDWPDPLHSCQEIQGS